jgi:hypothetical protein
MRTCRFEALTAAHERTSICAAGRLKFRSGMHEEEATGVGATKESRSFAVRLTSVKVT